MTTEICALCQTPNPLCESHIIPNAYFRKMKQERSGKLVTFDNAMHTPIGLTNESWSEPMLCKTCEGIFSRLEQRNIQSLRKTAKNIQGNSDHGTLLYSYDYKSLNHFLVSILWRAAVSKQIPFSEVALEPKVIEEIRVQLLNGMTPVHKNIHCQIKKIKDGTKRILTSRYEGVALSPSAEKLGRCTMYTFIFAGYLIRYFHPSIPFSFSRQQGFVKNEFQLFVPTIEMKNIPELMNPLTAAYGKAITGQVSF
ncbi:hypothetical protein [Collimonas humicola]|uniref:hypothetical protein n=1 Tax=Collimonas humicola TaxID=2825886 RepID=UPI001B8D1B15|nr:hypothetical protein [Collimonas humicola]